MNGNGDSTELDLRAKPRVRLGLPAAFRLLERARDTARLVAGRLRAIALAARGARVGAKVWIGPNCTFEKPWCISLGARVRLEEGIYVKIVDDSARISIGDYAFLGRGTELDVSTGIEIGRHALLAPGCFVTDHSHGFRQAGRRIDEQGCTAAPVSIGDDSWLGAGTIVLMGASIGDGAVVGAGSVVRRAVPAREVHAGVPARRIGGRT